MQYTVISDISGHKKEGTSLCLCHKISLIINYGKLNITQKNKREYVQSVHRIKTIHRNIDIKSLLETNLSMAF